MGVARIMSYSEMSFKWVVREVAANGACSAYPVIGNLPIACQRRNFERPLLEKMYHLYLSQNNCNLLILVS